jgi:hypothetical protein
MRHRWFRARLTCSIVISGFSPPKPIRVFGDKSHHHQAQDHVPHQGHVTARLEMAEAYFRLGHPNRMFHMPPAKRHAHQLLQRRLRRSVREEILDLRRRRVAGHDQPVAARRHLAFARQVNLPAADFPGLCIEGQARQRHPLPVELVPGRAEPGEVVGSFSAPTSLGSFAARSLGQTAEISAESRR